MPPLGGAEAPASPSLAPPMFGGGAGDGGAGAGDGGAGDGGGGEDFRCEC